MKDIWYYRQLIEQYKLTERIHNSYYVHNKKITGHVLIDEYLLRLIIKKEFKIELLPRPQLTLARYDVLTTISTNQFPINDSYVREYTYNLEKLCDRFGNQIYYYFDKIDSVLYLYKEPDYFDFVTIFDWDFDPFKFELTKELESDDFYRFECIRFSHKCILTIIPKHEIRHMWE